MKTIRNAWLKGYAQKHRENVKIFCFLHESRVNIVRRKICVLLFFKQIDQFVFGGVQ